MVRKPKEAYLWCVKVTWNLDLYLWIKLVGAASCSFMLFSVFAFMLLRQSWGVKTEIVWPIKSNIYQLTLLGVCRPQHLYSPRPSTSQFMPWIFTDLLTYWEAQKGACALVWVYKRHKKWFPREMDNSERIIRIWLNIGKCSKAVLKTGCIYLVLPSI